MLTAMWLRPWSHQNASRYLATVAAVDAHQVDVEPWRPSLGVDYAVVDGRAVSDKAPMGPWLGIPPYAVYRAFGGDAFPRGVPYEQVGTTGEVGVWLVTLVAAVIPAAALLALMRRVVAEVDASRGLLVAVAMSLGSQLLPFGSMLFGHELAALQGFAAWVVLRRQGRSPAALLAGGVLLGIGPSVEFPQVAVALVIGIACLVLHRARAAWVVVGGVVGMVPLLVYNTAVFGAPFRTAYQGFLPNFQGSGAFGVFNLQPPQPKQVLLALVGDRGLWTITPVLFFGLVGAVLLLRRRSPHRIDGVVAIALLVLYVILSTGIAAFGGMSPGPRYLVPVMPFFALPLAVVWRRIPLVCGVAAVYGAVCMLLAIVADPLYADEFTPAVLSWASTATSGPLQRSVLTSSAGSAGTWALLAVGVALVGIGLVLDRRRHPFESDSDSEPDASPSPTPSPSLAEAPG